MTCEDFPCCGHERGDCEGQLYGSDESIKNDPHVLCDHETGDCEVADRYAGEYDDYDEENMSGPQQDWEYDMHEVMMEDIDPLDPHMAGQDD